MTTSPDPPSVWTDPTARSYLLICMVAVLVMFMNEMERGFDYFTPFPIVAALLGLVIRSSLASLMMLFLLTLRLFLYHLLVLGTLSSRFWYIQPRRFNLSDVIMGGAVLAYMIAHLRLAGLVSNIFPGDPRHREPRPKNDWGGGGTREVRQRRSVRLVGPMEWIVFLLALPVFPLLANLLWLIRPKPWAIGDLPPVFWRWTALIAPAWLLAVVLLVTGSLLGYWRRRNMTSTEGQLVLQDIVWKETRREQRRVNRWLAWDRWRRQRHEEPS
jgi:hypothetical protein